MARSVSVVIPAYNHERFVGIAVASALRQTRPPLEIVVVDDGSTDATASRVAEFGPDVRLISQPNGGVSSARNTGIAEASGDLIAFLDADDEWCPAKLERQVAAFEADPDLGLVHCAVEDISADGAVLARHIDGLSGWVADELLLLRRPVVLGGGSGFIVPRDVLHLIGGFDPRLSTSADWDVVYRVARSYRIGFVPEVLLRYRLHGGNMHTNIDRMRSDMLLAFDKAFDGASAADVAALRRRSYGQLHLLLSGSYLRNGHPYKALRHLAGAACLQPAALVYGASLPLRTARRRWTRSSV
jgi:glycosyltransferase involved in cell wall biosynthesis